MKSSGSQRTLLCFGTRSLGLECRAWGFIGVYRLGFIGFRVEDYVRNMWFQTATAFATATATMILIVSVLVLT